MSHIFNLVRAAGDGVKKTTTIIKSGYNASIECSNARKSIGNGFPLQKYVGAVVRGVIRVVLAAESDSDEVAGDPGAGQPRRGWLRGS